MTTATIDRAEEALVEADIQPELDPTLEFRPHAGPQEAFLSTLADIAIYGGAAGGGKTTGIIWEAARYVHVPGFNGVIFRRTHPEIINPGGLWDESEIYYPALGGIPKSSSTTWNFPFVGTTLKFNHMQLESDKNKWQGAQLCFIGFDEVTHFTKTQFFYMLSRNRSICGIRPYIRATCNPDPDSWVRLFIDWWIGDDGFPIPERAGVLRWMGRDGDEIIWANTREEIAKLGKRPKSVTFIPSTLDDNPTLCEKDPDYRGNLEALPKFERERLLDGNWDARPVAGDYFKREYYPVVDEAPAQGRVVRWWDRAATELSEKNQNPDWTVGLKLLEHRGLFYILDIIRFRGNPLRVEKTIVAIAAQEQDVEVLLPQDPGAAGKSEVAHLTRLLKGRKVYITSETGSKAVRAKPVSAASGAGNIIVVRGKWNTDFYDEVESFDGLEKSHDDQVDSLSGAYNYLTTEHAKPGIRSFN